MLFASTMLGMVVCSAPTEELPPVKTPESVHLACWPPAPFPLTLNERLGGTCLYESSSECVNGYTLVALVDRRGRATEAFLREKRSPSLDACVLASVQQMPFEPARECNGDALPGEYRVSFIIACTLNGKRVPPLPRRLSEKGPAAGH